MSLRRWHITNYPAYSWFQFFAAKVTRAKIIAQAKETKKAVCCVRLNHKARYFLIGVEFILIYYAGLVKA